MEELTRIVDSLTEYNNKAKYLLKINGRVDASDLRQCFSLFWENDIYNLVVVLENGTHTWYPYNKYNKIISTNITQPFSNKIPKAFHEQPVKLIWSPVSILTTSPHQRNLGYINRILNLIGEKIGLRMLFNKKEEPVAVREHRNKVKAVNLTRTIVEKKIDIVAIAYVPSVALITTEGLELSFPVVVHTDYWLLPRMRPLALLLTLILALTLVQYFQFLFSHNYLVFK